LASQLLTYVGKVIRLDLGYSYRNQSAFWILIDERLPATLLLLGSAFLLSSLIALGLGILAALSARRRGWLDKLISTLATLLYAAPSFWLALLLIILFSLQLGWLPAFGMETVAASLSGWDRVVDLARHLLLPAFTLACLFLALYIQLTRSSLLEVFRQEFVRTAQAKGLAPRRILFAHVLRNGLLPVVTFAGLQLGQLASASLL